MDLPLRNEFCSLTAKSSKISSTSEMCVGFIGRSYIFNVGICKLSSLIQLHTLPTPTMCWTDKLHWARLFELSAPPQLWKIIENAGKPLISILETSLRGRFGRLDLAIIKSIEGMGDTGQTPEQITGLRRDETIYSRRTLFYILTTH